jgi:hypothetical protein
VVPSWERRQSFWDLSTVLQKPDRTFR